MQSQHDRAGDEGGDRGEEVGAVGGGERFGEAGRVADDGDQDRGAEHGADLAEGGVDGAGGGEAVVGDVADGGGAEGREGEADPDPGQAGARQPEPEPVRFGASRAQHHHPGGEDHRAGDDHGAVAEAVGEAAGGSGEDGRERRARQRRGAGLEHGVAPDRGQEKDVAEDQREEGEGEEQGAEVAEAEGAVGEQGRLDDRARVGGAAVGDGGEQGEAGDEAAEGAGRGPAPVVALDDPQRNCRQRERQHRRPRQVRQAAVEDLRSRQVAAAGDQDGGAERQVDEEDEAPVGELDQGAAEGRADGGRRRCCCPPEADAGGAALGREAVEDDRQRGRRDHRRGDSLQDPEGDQQRQAGRHRAEQAGDGEAGHPQQEDPLVAEAVGEPPGRDQQGRDDDEVAVQHPGEFAPLCPGEGGRDVGEGDVDDRRVEEGDESAGAGDRHRALSMPTVIHRPRL